MLDHGQQGKVIILLFPYWKMPFRPWNLLSSISKLSELSFSLVAISVPHLRVLSTCSASISATKTMRELVATHRLADCCSFFEHLQLTKQADICQYNIMLEISRYDVRKSLLQHMYKHGPQPDVASYTILMCPTSTEIKEEIKENPSKENAEMVLDMMDSLEVEPKMGTYLALLTVYRDIGNANGVEFVFHMLEKHGLTPTLEMYMAAIQAGTTARNAGITLQFSLRMINSRLKVNERVLDNTFQALLGFNQPEIAEMLVKAAAKVGFDVGRYLLLLTRSYAEGNRIKEMEMVLVRLRLSGNPIPPPIIMCVIDTYVRANWPQGLDKILISALVDDTFSREKVFTKLICAYEILNAPSKIPIVLKRMRVTGMNVSVHIYTLLLKAMVRMRNYTRVRQVKKYMEMDGVKPNTTITTYLLKSCVPGTNISTVLDIIEWAEIHTVWFDTNCFNEALSALVNTGDIKRVFWLVEKWKLKQQPPPFNEKTLNILCRFLYKKGKGNVIDIKNILSMLTDLSTIKDRNILVDVSLMCPMLIRHIVMTTLGHVTEGCNVRFTSSNSSSKKSVIHLLKERKIPYTLNVGIVVVRVDSIVSRLC